MTRTKRFIWQEYFIRCIVYIHLKALNIYSFHLIIKNDINGDREIIQVLKYTSWMQLIPVQSLVQHDLPSLIGCGPQGPEHQPDIAVKCLDTVKRSLECLLALMGHCYSLEPQNLSSIASFGPCFELPTSLKENYKSPRFLITALSLLPLPKK